MSAAKAVELIDLNKHRGEHPRIGAVDVIPFVPLVDMAMNECVQMAHQLGQRVAEELCVPVYFYEEAALRAGRRDLAWLRRGGFEVLKEAISSPGRAPDLGPPKVHPTGGAVAIGARGLLIAFNVNLDTGDVGIAKEIAKAIREKGGRLKYVKAIGVDLKEKGLAQVSMNLTNPAETPIYRVFEFIKAEAQKRGVSIAHSELIGCISQAALIDLFKYYIQLKDLKSSQILDNWLAKMEE